MCNGDEGEDIEEAAIEEIAKKLIIKDWCIIL